MMPEGKTMYTVRDLIEHLQWYNPEATVSTKDRHSNNLYLSMDGSSADNVLLLFEPRHTFNDIRSYYWCDRCQQSFIYKPRDCKCYWCGDVVEFIKKREVSNDN